MVGSDAIRCSDEISHVCPKPMRHFWIVLTWFQICLSVSEGSKWLLLLQVVSMSSDRLIPGYMACTLVQWLACTRVQIPVQRSLTVFVHLQTIYAARWLRGHRLKSHSSKLWFWMVNLLTPLRTEAVDSRNLVFNHRSASRLNTQTVCLRVFAKW